MQTLLTTTINATCTVPVATLCKGDERVTSLEEHGGFSQQQAGTVIEQTEKGKRSPSQAGRAHKGRLVKDSTTLGHAELGGPAA